MQTHDALLANVRGFMRSRVILTAAALDLFTLVHREPAPARRIATVAGTDPRATTRLLDCLVTFGLLDKKDGLYRTTASGALFSADHPDSIRPMVMHQNRLWDIWSHLTESVRLGANPHRRSVHEEGGESLEAFIGAMHVVGREVAARFAAACAPDRFSRLLDVGGGSGSYTIAFLRRNPAMTAVLFDHPDVIRMAEQRLRTEGLLDRVTLVGGDFYRDELPAGCDVALLSAIIHQNGVVENLDLYRKIHRALAPGGAVIIRDHVMNDDRTDPPAGALFALNMLVATPAGDTYTFAEIRDALENAGFVSARVVLGGGGEKMDGLVEARKTAGSL
jgi:precorrin-6B methylase 2/predicted transcriptional regulator